MNNQNPRDRFSLKRSISIPFLGMTIVYCCFLFYLSSISTFPVEPPFKYFDKVVHFFLFGGLSGTLVLALKNAEREYHYKTLLVVPVAFSLLYGLSDEIHQLFVPYRTFAVSDIAADTVGAVVAASVLLLLYHKVNSRRKEETTGA